MPTVRFWKYQGAGNDFVMLNGFVEKHRLSTTQIKSICDRRFGVGADGLIILKPHRRLDFEMVYYNADGRLGTFCGNGSRASVLFAIDQGIVSAHQPIAFEAADGQHLAKLLKRKNALSALLEVTMNDVLEIKKIKPNVFFLNTGSPHLVIKKQDCSTTDVVSEGKKWRYDEAFATIGGVNVNFYSEQDKHLHIRTYERGVEDETLACGTGITATAIVSSPKVGKQEVSLRARGGHLNVAFVRTPEGTISNITLRGEASLVFEGAVNR